MSWLLFGGSGQLGRSFQEYLKQNQIEFMAPSSNSLNLISYDSIERYIRLNKPEVVVNCAAWTDVSAAEKHERNVFALNAFAPKNIAFAAKKLVHSLYRYQLITYFRVTGQCLGRKIA